MNIYSDFDGKFPYEKMANSLRILSIDAIEKAKSGHPGLPLGMADVVTILFQHFFKFIPHDPRWINRDRLIFSAGHGSMLLYSILFYLGYPDINLDDIKNFRSINSKTAGHPEFGELEAIETTTGPLGQGLANAVGMAIAESKLRHKFGSEYINNKIYVIVGDGCLMEGISHEALSLAGHLALDNLIVIFDDNNITIDGSTDLTISDDLQKRIESYGFDFYKADGHNYQDIYNSFSKVINQTKPIFISFKTIIGKGAPNKQGTASCHGAPLGAEESELFKKNLNWKLAPFEIDYEVLAKWRNIYNRNVIDYENWKKHPNDALSQFINFKEFESLADDLSRLAIENNSDESTRKSSGRIIKLISEYDNFIGGSADLSESTFSLADSSRIYNRTNRNGNYIYYGIREHAMAAIMSGISLYGGFRAFGGTFLVFSDYARPAIRLAAMMEQGNIFIMTHDSIGLGEDGPTHQPIEHLSSLRLIPNLQLFRPCDLNETIELWKIAINSTKTPTIFSLTRQNVTQYSSSKSNEVYKGIYCISAYRKESDIAIFASGSEVSLAMKTKEILEQNGIVSNVYSCPSLELFDRQSLEYQNEVLKSKINVVIEAGSKLSYCKYFGKQALYFCIDEFGKSGKYQDIYNYFGLTPENISKLIIKKVKNGL